MYNYGKKMFTGRAKPIRITSVRISGVLLRVPNKLINYIVPIKQWRTQEFFSGGGFNKFS